MSEYLNLKLKDGLEPSILLKYGFIPKYDEDTGEIKKYLKEIYMGGKGMDKHHFTFVLHTQHILGGIFRKKLYYDAWMTGFTWSHLCDSRALNLVYNLIKDGVVEPYEEL